MDIQNENIDEEYWQYLLHQAEAAEKQISLIDQIKEESGIEC